mgnify:CR=1 FL=1
MADPRDDGFIYDEFALFADNAADAGLAWTGPPTVQRVEHRLDDGRTMSALRWGSEEPRVVLLHGGGQNAHTWDTMALALGLPLLAIDLPGHGHSDEPAADVALSPRVLATDMAATIAALAPHADAVIGMSLGGMTSLGVAVVAPALVRRLMLIDITPGTDREKASDIIAFLAGPESFASFDEILERTVAFNPTRSESSLIRGILHNAVERDDGRWVWRHQRAGRERVLDEQTEVDFDALWDDLARVAVPTRLLVGDRSPVVSDADVERFRALRPDDEVITVADAGHSIQGDQPLVLADHVRAFLD